MATNTYEALRTTTLSSAASSVTLNLSGITGYTDLVIVATPKHATQLTDFTCRFNSDTSGNAKYSATMLKGDGSSASSYRNSNQDQATLGEADTNNFNPFIIQINNYANTTTYKTIMSRSSTPAYYTAAWVSLWRDTSAITSITLAPLYGGSFGGQNIAAGSTFTVYGIAKGTAVPTTAKATGGTITYGTDYTYHVFTGSGTFTPSQNLSCDYLVIAGGGGGGNGAASADNGGGGGAGGYRTAYAQALTSGTGYTVTVGAGGGAGSNGSNSSLASFAATGGGHGGGGNSYTASTGGSGGGAGNATASGQARAGNAGGYSPVEGYDGSEEGGYWAGGGGGAGAVGTIYGGGGDGVYTTLGPTSRYYAGGGGGGFNSYADRRGLGGLGGGGIGSDYAGQWSWATAGETNTGSGGGGGASQGGSIPGAGGGSGLVIIRYAN